MGTPFIIPGLLLGPFQGLLVLGAYGKLGVYVLCRVQTSFPTTEAHKPPKAQPSAAPHWGASRPCGLVLCAFVAGKEFLHSAEPMHTKLAITNKN